VGVGMLHGVGAETPTQVILFLATAHAGGPATGIAVLLAFLAGLLVSNSAITVLGATGFRRASTRPTVHVAMATVTTLVSVVIGTALVIGNRPVAF
jgi:high-affinity nickel-transport protein